MDTDRRAASAIDVGGRAAVQMFAAYALLPNAIFWLLGRRLYLMRPLLNVDYLLLGALAVVLRRRWLWLLLVPELMLDAVVNVAPAFHFELGEFIPELSDLLHVDAVWAVSGAAALTAAALLVAAAMWRTAGKPPARHALLLLGATLIISIADIANGTSLLPFAVTRSFVDVNIANSAALKTAHALWLHAEHAGPGSWKPLDATGSASGPLLAAARDGSALPPRIGLVNVESWGLFRDPALADLLAAPLLTPAIQARYVVERGTVPFHGATIDGEFRELCGVRLVERGSSHPPCLPELLRGRGYETVALHGFTSQFYDRARWYPEIGFERPLFAADLRQRGLVRTCGSGFAGLCDPDVGAVMADELSRGPATSPRLVYWMTLNSHLPLRDADASGAPFDCSAPAAAALDSDVCLHARVLSRALESVAAAALDPRMPPAEFVVVGDHGPPSLSIGHRSLYDQGRVPFVRLVPR